MLSRKLLSAAIVAKLAIPATATSADSVEMTEVSRVFEQMKAENERKIETLEKRLKAAGHRDIPVQ
ncbi:MAG: hypothetical protein KUF77_04090 [Candidatus Thiodiazotropha sp. (ex Lucina aurantia)]|uniref:Uncharacterized protein n=1 Tax=Candidatus Thiodiazotropha taylori TaxID=2792791 RepID=A0A9E4TSL7_9GAMM|nr:hypothetical protein [Candidatus Thiodiazotropha taylori]MBT3030826.1 hypothetical protein [Candidatus Thiodiazotropha sp. (ex Lucina pensylvanica)]MBT3040220.1 hypothetical protein [Candidatus Thiodiazotropha sp. (ex Codakia orbicularis)]MBV2102187.1 hypothetical protein [Candidatus Thiodiazotropha sp. (ex Lucina aurantia)]MCW4236531.1 hypothetical protein [Candidatus Thiodiazotropha endolucinida]